MSTLPESWIERIFARMQGIYGSQFLSKFTYIQDGVDVGMENAKKVWADELGGFADKPEALAYALKNLPNDFPPNALEFAEICRRAPRKELPALEVKYDATKSKDFAEKLAEVVNGGNRGADPIFWATHLKTELQLEFIRGAAKNVPEKFQPCLDHLIATGVVSQNGMVLQKRYAGMGQWVKA